MIRVFNTQSDETLTKPRQYLDTKQTLSQFESFKSRSSAITSHKSYVECSKFLSASVTSSQKSRELKIATLRGEEIERQNEAKFRLKL